MAPRHAFAFVGQENVHFELVGVILEQLFHLHKRLGGRRAFDEIEAVIAGIFLAAEQFDFELFTDRAFGGSSLFAFGLAGLTAVIAAGACAPTRPPAPAVAAVQRQ